MQPGQDGPLPILMYGFLIRAGPPLRNKVVLIYNYIHRRNIIPQNNKYINLQSKAFIALFVMMYEFEPIGIHHVERLPLIIPQL